MKKLILLSFICFISPLWGAGGLYAQTWVWAKHIYSNSSDIAYRICKDDENNIYVGGTFNNVCFLQTDTFYPNGTNDFFIVKYDNSGNELWAKQFGGDNNIGFCPEGLNISYDSENNYLYIYSHFCGTATFGDSTFSSFNRDVAVIKLDTSGNAIWVRQAGGNGTDAGGGLGIDEYGTIYISGTNTSSATFGSFNVPPGGFLAKYDSIGTCVWAKSISGLASTGINGNAQYVSSDMIYYNNSIYINGSIGDDTLMIDTISIIRPNSYGAALANFNLNGDVQWVKLYGYPSASGFDVVKDGSDNFYVTGQFYADSAVFDNEVIYNNGQIDGFISKYNSSGDFIWVEQIHASGGGGQVNSIAFNNDSTFYATGKFSGSATFGDIQTTATQSSDMFLARYTTNGECFGVVQLGKAIGYVQTDNNGSPIVAGYFQGPQLQIEGEIFTNMGGGDIFIAKHDIITDIATSKTDETGNGLIIYANPNKGSFNVEVPSEVTNLNGAVLLVYDNQGKETANFSLDNNTTHPRFDISNAAKGMYVIKLTQGNKTYTGKLVVE